MSRIKRILLTIAATLGLLMPAAVPAVASAQNITDNLKKGSCLSATDVDCEETENAAGSVNDIIADAINIFSLVVGVIAVIMIIVGGVKYITSGGDAGNVTGAKNTILYAVVGLVIVALAQIIVRFVLDTVTD
jgi:hypothetical protein